jgi:hypothetical protein
MGKLYNALFYSKTKLLILILLTLGINEVKAQRTLKMYISEYKITRSSGTDCDGGFCLDGNGTIDLATDVDGAGWSVDEYCHEFDNNNPNQTKAVTDYVWDRTYSAACNWPGGSIDFDVEFWDRDQFTCITEVCSNGGFLNVSSDLIARVDVTQAVPANNAASGTYGPYTFTAPYNANYDGGGNCAGTCSVTVYWVVGGAFPTGPDLICNAVQVGAAPIGLSGNQQTGLLTNNCTSNSAGEPQLGDNGNTSSTWTYFETPSSNIPTEYTIRVSQDGSDKLGMEYRLFKSPYAAGSASCPTIGQLTANTIQNSDGNSTTQMEGIDCADDDAVGRYNCLQANSRYYIMVDGENDCWWPLPNDPWGNYRVRVSANSYTNQFNDICNADDRGTIAVNTTNTIYGNNTCATTQAGEVDVVEPTFSVTNMSPTKTMWYKFKTPATGGPYLANVNSDYGFTNFDIEMALWESPLGTCNFGDLIQKEWNDDINIILFNQKSAFTADCLPANSTFYLQVDGDDGGDYGNYQVTINIQNTANSAPSNDNLCDATNMGSSVQYNTVIAQQSNDNECSSIEPGEPFYSGFYQAKYTTWHKFTITSTASLAPAFMTVDADGTTGNQWYSIGHSTVSNIYKQNGASSCSTNNNMANISVVDYEDDNFIVDADISNRTFCVEPGATYWVQVDGQTLTNIALLNFDQQGNYNINASPSDRYTSNDNICNAEDLGTLSFNTNIDIDRQNFCATKQTGEPWGDGSAQTDDNTVWFKFIAPTTNRPHSYSIDLEDLSGNILEAPNPRLYYDPTPATCGNFAELESVENVEDEWQWLSEFPLDPVDWTNQRYSCLVPGGTYYLQMTVRDVATGLLPVPGADNYMKFKLRIISDQEVTATNDEPCTATWLNGTGIIPAAPLPINIPDQNYGLVTALNNQNNFCATAGNPNADLPTSDYQDIDQTVWYKFIAPKSGSVLFQITTPYDDEITIQAAVYQPLKFKCTDIMLEVSSMGMTAIIDRDIEWPDKFYAHCLIPDSTYYLRVDGLWLIGAPIANDEFRGKFKIEARDYDAWKAPNDDICSHISLGTPTASGVSAKNVQYPSYAGVYPTNYCATAYGEPVPTAFSPVNTVWYSFIAPASGRVAVKAINDPAGTGDEIWLRLAVWKTSDFTCLGTATELASEADDGSVLGFDYDLCNVVNPTFGDAEHCLVPPVECEAHRDEFIKEVKCLDPGKRYYIMVDGWSYNNPTTGCGDGNQDKFGRFELLVYDLGGPAPNVANDNACDAESMGNPGLIPGSFVQRLNQNNSCATVETGEPDPLGWDYNGGTSLNTSTNDGPQKTLWYKFIAPLTGSVTIQAWNTTSGPDNSLDLQLAVYDPGTNPCDITKFKEVKAQYDRLLFGAFGSKDEDMQVNCLTPGKTYYLQVDGDQTSVSCLDGGGILDAGYLNGDNCIDGFFNLKITTAATGILATNNDDLCIAQNMGTIANGGSKATSALESNWCATEEVGEPNTSQTSNQYDPDYDETVWYRFKTGSNPGTIKAEITNATLLNALVFGGSFLISIYESKSNCPTTTCSGSTPNWSDLVMKANSNVILAPVSPFLSPANEVLEMACAKPDWNYYIQIDALDLPAVEFNIGGIQTHTQYGTFKLTVSSDNGGTPPLEDNACNAVNMGVLAASGTLSQPNRNNYCSGIDPGEPWVNGDPNDVNSINYDETVWYKFTTANTPGQSRNVRVRVDGDNLLDPDPIDIGFVVYGGTLPCNSTCNTLFPTASFKGLLEMDRADVPYVFDESVDIECLKPNTTYYIQIDGNDITGAGVLQLDKGNFSITVTDLGSGPVQNNDLICNATALGTFTGGSQNFAFTNQSNACASEQRSEPNVSGGTDFSADSYDETVWYYFVTGASPGEVTVNVNGCSYASRWQGFTVYRGGPGDYLTACNINYFPLFTQVGSTGLSGCNPTMKLTCLEPNTHYWIQVDAFDDLIDGNVDGNGFNISVTDNGTVTTRPANDQIANVHDFGQLTSGGSLVRTRAGGYFSVLNNYCATDEVNEPNADWSVPDDDVNADETVWYRFRMGFVGDATLNFSNTNLGAEVNITGNLYRNTGMAGAATFANLQHVGSFTQVPFILQDFTFSCLTVGEYYLQVDGLDVGGGQDPDASSGTNLSRGEWDLSIQNIASAFANAQHDNIANAYSLGTPACGGSVSLPFNSVETNNTCATVQAGEPNVDNNDETVWFYFTAPAGANSPITVTVDGDDALIAGRDWDMHPSIYVYHSTTGAATSVFSNLEQVASGGTLVPDYINKTATATFDCAVPGHVYYVQIDGWDGPLADEYGKFSVSVSSGACPAPPANDEPCSATNLGTPGTNTCTSAGYAGGGTNAHQYNFNANATVSNTPSGLWDDACANSYCAGDVWYKFTASQTGNVIIEGSQQGSNIAGIPTQPTEIGVSVYREIGGSCGNLQYVTCKTGGITPLSGTDMELETSVAVTAGETYYIKVYDADGSYNAQWYRLCLTQTCSADNCAAALTLQDGVSQCWDLETSDGEPLAQSYRDCNTNETALNSIYYKFTTSSDPVAAASGVNITMFGNMNVVSDVGIDQYTGCTIFGIFACDRDGVSVGIFEDATPCDGAFDKLIDCVTTDVCNGGAWGFSKNYTDLKPGTTYIIQVNSQDDGLAINCAASLDAIDFGSITVTSLDPDNPALPIELVSFTGYNNGEVNILNWVTASELNNDYFTIERSFDGISFIPIGTVEGAGNSNSLLSYSLTDLAPQVGNNYYRLKQTDYDGKFTYSQIINIPIGDSPAQAQTSITGVYPNPTTGQLNIDIMVVEDELSLNFRVTNIVGQQMKNAVETLLKGKNTIQLDATDYAAGMYILNLSNKERDINLDHKFIKQ